MFECHGFCDEVVSGARDETVVFAEFDAERDIVLFHQLDGVYETDDVVDVAVEPVGRRENDDFGTIVSHEGLDVLEKNVDFIDMMIFILVGGGGGWWGWG